MTYLHNILSSMNLYWGGWVKYYAHPGSHPRFILCWERLFRLGFILSCTCKLQLYIENTLVCIHIIIITGSVWLSSENNTETMGTQNIITLRASLFIHLVSARSSRLKVACASSLISLVRMGASTEPSVKYWPLCSVKMLEPSVRGSLGTRGLPRAARTDAPLGAPRSFACCAPIAARTAHDDPGTRTPYWAARRTVSMLSLSSHDCAALTCWVNGAITYKCNKYITARASWPVYA